MAHVQQISVNERTIEASEVEAKLGQGNIEDAISFLKEALSISHEEAVVLLGRFEYQRRKFEAAIRVFEVVDTQAAIQQLQASSSDKGSSKGGRYVLLELIYRKSLALQKLGKLSDAIKECKTVLDAVEKIGIQDACSDKKMHEIVCKFVELLPELWRLAGDHQELISAYRNTILGQWNLDNDCCSRIHKRFAAFLLFGSVNAGTPTPPTQVEGSFVPKNNTEEAVLLLMVQIRKCYLGKTKLDHSVMELLTFTMTICGQTSLLARQYEELLPGTYPRCSRWNSLALCYSGAGNDAASLNLLRKSLGKHESPNDLLALLLAAKVCSNDRLVAAEGVEYARRAIANAQDSKKHVKGVGLRFLGICLGRQSKAAFSDYERSCLQSEALKSLEEAITLEKHNPDLLYELGLLYAENHNMNAALKCAKKFIDGTGGSILKGWRLLALILSAQQRYLESEVVTEAALDETAKWEQGPLLRIKAKLKAAQNLPADSVEIYRFLLALVQAQRKSQSSAQNNSQVGDDKINDSEFEVWHGLANLYFKLSQWRDTEICLEKARAIKPYSAVALSSEGAMHEARGKIQEALSSYSFAVSVDLGHVPSKVTIGALLWKIGSRSYSVARGFLSDALRLEPTNRSAWFYLGMVHRDDGRTADAAECFQAAAMLDESGPIESFDCAV